MYSIRSRYVPAAIADPYTLFAMNRSCWEAVPAIGGSCPFESSKAQTDATRVSAKQVLIRFLVFVVIEHVQFGIIFAMKWWGNKKKNASKKSWHLHRLTQVRVSLTLQSTLF